MGMQRFYAKLDALFETLSVEWLILIALHGLLKQT